jgi:hypothetical protein
VTAEAEGGPVPTRAAHSVHPPVAPGIGAVQGDAAPSRAYRKSITS